MRPVNLIPPEERRGGARSSRTGPAAYVLIGALVAVLAAVTGVVMTNNKIADSEAEIASLEQEEAAATARAESLSAYAEFAAAEQARTETVTSLAQSRFDWERVIRELAVIIPPGTTLKTLTGTVTPSVTMENESDSRLRDEVAGPALSLTGCAPGQDGVAALVAALEDIDGVTRVGLANSEHGDSSDTGSAASINCYDGTKFEIVTAFDEVVVPTADSAAPATPAPPADDGGVTEAAQQQAAAAESTEHSAQQAETAVTSTSGG